MILIAIYLKKKHDIRFIFINKKLVHTVPIRNVINTDLQPTF